MIIFSDLHLNEKTADTVFNEVLPGLHEAVVGEPDKTLACLGDFYHVRYKVDVGIQNRVFEWFKTLSNCGVVVWLLPGNHDQINEKGDNALQPFAELGNVSVFTNPVTGGYGTWLPYRKNKEEITSFLKNENVNRNKPIFMHQGIQTFEINNGLVDNDGIDPTFLATGTQLVISGHYHKRQSKGVGIHYVGSPYQVNASEAGQDKGYCRYDYNTGDFEYLTTNWGPKYFNLGELPKGTKITDVKAGDVIRVKAPIGSDLEVFRKSLDVPDGVSCVVEPQVSEYEQRLSVGDNVGFEDYVKAYVAEFGGNLDHKVLLDVYSQLVGVSCK